MGRSQGERQATRPWRAATGAIPARTRWVAPWVAACAVPVLAAFPPLEWHALGWVALAPLVAGVRSARGPGPWGWAAAGWAFGWVFWGMQFGWLYDAFVVEAGMGRLHFANAFGLLLAVLALGPAAMLGISRALWLRWGLTPLVVQPVLWAALDALLGLAPFGGLGWGSLAGPQAHTWAARLLAPVLGGAGVVLALGAVNAAWALWGRHLSARPSASPVRLVTAGLLLCGLTLLALWPAPPAATPVTGARSMLLVPGDLSLHTLDAERDTPGPLRHYLRRTLAALATHSGSGSDSPVLVVWPESAVPGTVEQGRTLVELAEVSAAYGAQLLLGSNARVRGRETNALYLVSGAPFDFVRYDKHRLVPFGEYVPRGFGWLFRRKITAGEADYLAGEDPPILPWGDVMLGPAICFESILPGHVRAAVAAGAELLVAVANDAWLSPAAARQHLQLSALRGLEVARDVVFVANRGWTAHLRAGRALAAHQPAGGPVWVSPSPSVERTAFQRWGHGPLALVVGLALVLAWLRRGRP